MRGTAIRLGALAIIAISLYAQPKPKDIAGWDKITWGMTIAEVRSAYHIDTPPENKDGWSLLQLKPVRVAGVEMGVEAGARQDAGKVSSVTLWSYFGLPNSAPLSGPQDFDTLKIALTDKYGPPASDESTRGENFRLLRSVRWIFPSTSILLTLEQSSSLPDLGDIYLRYSATDKKR